MKRKHSKVIKFIHTLRKQIKKTRIPLYSAKKYQTVADKGYDSSSITKMIRDGGRQSSQ